jgi:hypothetical protein
MVAVGIVVLVTGLTTSTHFDYILIGDGTAMILVGQYVIYKFEIKKVFGRGI